jgi:hypothetical protein
MSIDIRYEKLIRLSDVPKLKCLPRGQGSKRPHIATIYRWSMRGLKGIRLETIRGGGSLCTSMQALQRFFDALTPERRNERPCDFGFPPHGRRWLARRQREIERAERECDRAGI